jgi:hypothetical protein
MPASTVLLAAYNFARRLKPLGGLTPYDYICKIWTSEPERCIHDPIQQKPGMSNWESPLSHVHKVGVGHAWAGVERPHLEMR